MTNYRRNFIARGSFFFTVNLAERRLRLLTQHIDELCTAFRETRRHHPFAIDAMVVLPDHLHTIWTLPEGDADFATRWRLIKSAFSRSMATGERISDSRAAKGERGIWQRRYWEHTIRDEKDFARHMDYIHINPVKHGLVAQVGDWPYSSFHRMVKLGIYPEDWQAMSRMAALTLANGRRTFSKVMGFARAQPILRRAKQNGKMIWCRKIYGLRPSMSWLRYFVMR
jgi:putative transposase